MTPGRWENPTRRFGPPEDWDAEKFGECETLDVIDQDGFMYSTWVPSPEELKLLNEGKPIVLGIRGEAHPVVSVGVGR